MFDDSSSSSDSSDDSQDIDVDDVTFDNCVNPLEGLRLPRSCMTDPRDVDMLDNMTGACEDATKHWRVPLGLHCMMKVLDGGVSDD